MKGCAFEMSPAWPTPVSVPPGHYHTAVRCLVRDAVRGRVVTIVCFSKKDSPQRWAVGEWKEGPGAGQRTWLVVRNTIHIGMAHRLWHEKAALARGIEYGSLRVRSEAEGQWKGERHEEPPQHCSEASKAASGSSHAGEARELGTRCRRCWQLGSQRRSPSQLREARGSMLPAFGSLQDPACPTDARGPGLELAYCT